MSLYTETMGDRVRALRKQYRFTQQYIAEQVGASRATVAAWEGDNATPQIRNLERLAQALNSTTHYILSGNRAAIDIEAEETFSGRLRKIRIERGLVQADIARLIDVKCATISLWEAGETMPNGNNLIALSKALRVNVEYLQSGDENDQSLFLAGLSDDAVKLIEVIRSMDQIDRRRLKAMRLILGIT